MISLRIQFLLLTFIIASSGIDLCKQYQTYKLCIGGDSDKCMWDNIRQLCYKTNDYLQGCSQLLNKKACLRQIGDVFGELAKCRFTTTCEEIPDLKTEKCYNNLSKSGCLSVQNPDYICIWKNDECITLNASQWDQVQDDFDSVLYSASACSHIQHYLAIHHTILWKLISYSPDLLTEADNLYKKELGIEIEDSIQYSDPATVSMQNNYVMNDGKFLWYTIRESKSITPSNLQKSHRNREGCIALEIESDSDFTNIFSLTGGVFGVNHVYCKYLNNNPSITDSYVFSKGSCQIFKYEELQDQNKIDLYELNCHSINYLQCIYFSSIKHSCKVRGKDYENPCVDMNEYPGQQAEGIYTSKQCQEKGNYFIESDTNLCVSKCFEITQPLNCISPCQYIYSRAIPSQIHCVPPNQCNQKGISEHTCKMMRLQCNWDYVFNRCYTLTDEEVSFLKCEDAFNVFVCTAITLSDQLCYWQEFPGKCINILDQPLLITHDIFVDGTQRTLGNMNLCKKNVIPAKFDKERRVCLFNSDQFNDYYLETIINKAHCIKSMSGYCGWNQYEQQCDCIAESDVKQKQCLDLIDVNEKLCQKAQTSIPTRTCVYNQDTSSCIEIDSEQISNIGCSGNGLSEEACIQKIVDGEYCQYSAGLCRLISIEQINSIRCSSLQKVNNQVCKMQSIFQVLCIYDNLTHSCYSPTFQNSYEFSSNLNRYACQAIQNSYTYFDIEFNKCVQFSVSNSLLFSSLECESNYVSQLTCKLITKKGQNCFWDTNLKRCRNYSELFNNCDEYANAPSRVCKALVTNMSRQFMKENYCSYLNNICQINTTVLKDCGEAEEMNIHRCGGMTGIDSSGNPVKMCAFINQVCQPLVESTMDTYITLNNIECKQANLATCTKITTPGQFCQIINSVDASTIIINKKCSTVTSQNYCNQLLSLSGTNPNVCAFATDNCFYDSIKGCQTPPDDNQECYTVGLSLQSCKTKTSNRRCAFINQKCQYIPEYKTSLSCSQLNAFSCQSMSHCTLNLDQVCEEIQPDAPFSELNSYYCSAIQEQHFYIKSGSTCEKIEDVNQYELYLCDTDGLNAFGCLNLPSQFCQYFNKKCQFHQNILCQDTPLNCENNNSNDQQCVLKDSQCFSMPNTIYQCNSFEKTNYLFCLQYPECIYYNSNCHSIIQPQSVNSCSEFSTIHLCTAQNKQHKCSYDSINNVCKNMDSQQSLCPSLIGYHSYQVCFNYRNCLHGYTKSGKGFCYENNDFSGLTCDELPEYLCTENLNHLNSNLKCYWDGECKSLDATITQCSQLITFQLNYEACLIVSNDECMYSHADRKCKFLAEFQGSVCEGATLKECNKIEKTCYFDGISCETSGTSINKYGCIQKSGLWKYHDNSCQELQSTHYQISCVNLSKEACLSDLTKELHCKWSNSKCTHVLEYENKQITSCDDLNQRACQSARYSDLQCQWNSTNKVCNQINLGSSNCSVTNGFSLTSLGLCSGQSGKNCCLNVNKDGCAEISGSIQLNNCNSYGLNRESCINLTTIPCIWQVNQNGGGYCENANLYLITCSDILNKYACQQVKTLNQFCLWDEDTKTCSTQTVSDCSSASNLNGNLGCKAVTQEPCFFDKLTQTCTKLEIIPITCEDYYNKKACQLSQSICAWDQNSCVNKVQIECSKFLNQSACLRSNDISCQWINNSCQDFKQLVDKVFCKDLPSNINSPACQSNAKDPCYFKILSGKCSPSQGVKNSIQDYEKVSDLLKKQTQEYQSPLLTSPCEELITKQDCINSRKENQACIWSNTCQTLTQLETQQCADTLNIWGCLGIKTPKQYCIWRGKCMVWRTSGQIMTNVNINVCIEQSVQSVYYKNSCVKMKLESITCESLGISKSTCLSITHQGCYWNTTTNSCSEYSIKNQKKCSDFSSVSPFVCQTQTLFACTYDKNTSSCKDFSENNLENGISKLGCLQNTETSTVWNQTKCEILQTQINCDSKLEVNSLTCQNIIDKPCIYKQSTNQCTSTFNIYMLNCNTIGLNLLGCTQVLSEPCIFKENKCQPFKDTTSPCMTISQVNAKACSSLQNQNCMYDAINKKCQSPLLTVDLCNVEGINKDICMSNSLCQWNSDNLNCMCKSDQEKEYCQVESPKDCINNLNCIYEKNQCIKKQCYHLNKDQCKDILDGKTCYLNKTNGCSPAKKCEDIIDSGQSCQSIFINQVPCIQGHEQCISPNNFDLFCPYSDCQNSNCFYESGICRRKTCSDIKADECYQTEGCYLDNNRSCQQLTSCSIISKKIFGDQALSICNQMTVNGYKCNWQKFALLDDTEVCTNQPCELYGPSTTLCQGNEMNGYSCVLSSELICRQCEQITEKCFCNKQTNICNFINGKCQSILCSQFIKQEQCLQASDRCYWSTQVKENGITSQGCVKECVKIVEVDECNSRIDECYYESLIGQCKKGKKSIPDLSVDIIIEQFFSPILSLVYLMIIIAQ